MVSTVWMNYNFLDQSSVDAHLRNFKSYAMQKIMNVHTHIHTHTRMAWMSVTAR